MSSTRALEASTHAVSPAEMTGAWLTAPRRGGANGRLLYLVGVHRRQRFVVLLAGANADHPLDRLHEDLAVTDLTGPRRRQDRVDAGLHERLGADHLDLHLLVKFHDERRAAILADDLMLAAVTAHATQRDAGDPGAKQRRLHLRQALRPYDRRDQFHRFLRASYTMRERSRTSACASSSF